MNQILFTNNNNNNYSKTDTKKIIRTFCIAIILIAIIIVSIKVYEKYQNGKSNIGVVAEISITKTIDEAKEATIKVLCEDGIQSLVYTWNDEDEKRINLNGSTSFERIIEIPENAINTLKVEVVSTKGVSSSKTEVFENSIDTTKPTVDSIAIVDKKLSVEISDDNGLKYLAYKWENEDEVIIEVPEEDNKKMMAEIDIQRGTYKLQIRVVDIYNNEETLSRLITGVNEPEITAIKYGNIIHVSVTHDMGLKQIEYIINRKKYVYDEEYSKYNKNQTTVEFDFPLDEGENMVQITAYSLEKTSDSEVDELENYSTKTFIGKCTYEP